MFRRYRDVSRLSTRAKKLTHEAELRQQGHEGGGRRGVERVSEFPRGDVAESSHGGLRAPLHRPRAVTLSTRTDAEHIFAHFAAVSGWPR